MQQRRVGGCVVAGSPTVDQAIGVKGSGLFWPCDGEDIGLKDFGLRLYEVGIAATLHL